MDLASAKVKIRHVFGATCFRRAVNSIFLISGTITFSHSIGKKMKHRYQSFTRIGRQFQSLERQVYADWTSVSCPLCKPLHGRYKFKRNYETHRKLNAIHSRSKNCFTPKIYCIEFAVKQCRGKIPILEKAIFKQKLLF